MKIKLMVLSLLIGAGGTFGVETAAQAGCNVYGCSQVLGIECNVYGCPNPPNGAECNVYGCPPPIQQRTRQQPKRIYQQANPADIATCVEKLRGYHNEEFILNACRGGR